MRITLHLDYAFRTLIFLATHPHRLVTTQEVSRAYGISKNHLVRVVQNLEKNGFVKLVPGRGGGMILSKEPAAIVLGDVVRCIEPNMDLAECFNTKTNTCVISPACRLKGVLRKASGAFLSTFDDFTLADVTLRSGDALRGLFPASPLSRPSTNARSVAKTRSP